MEQKEFVPIVDGYEVGWIDVPRDQSVVWHDRAVPGSYTEVVEPYVSAVGHTSGFIIARQHFNRDSTTAYFVIDVAKNRRASSDGVYGPLSAPAFDSLKAQLGIAKLDFDLRFPENPK